jgi:two-component system NtrC family sensor kinase
MNPFALSGLLTGISSLAFGYFVYWKGSNRLLNRLWFIFTVSVAAWGFGGMWIALAPTPSQALWAWRLAYACGVVWIPIFFYHFVHAFCNLPGRTFLILSYATGMIVLPLCFTNLFFSGVRLTFSSFYYALPGTVFPLFVVWWVTMVVYSHYQLYRKHRVTSGQKRSQIQYFFLATAIGYLGGSLDYLPIFGIDLYPYGNFAIVLYPMIMTYAIVQYRLMDIAVVTNKGLAHGLLIVLIFIPMSLAVFFTQRVTLYAIPPLLAGFLVFACGLWVVRSNPAAITNRTFGLLSLGACIWLMSMSMLYSTTDDDEATFWGKCIYLGIVYIPAVVYHFSVRLHRHTGNKLIRVNYLLGTAFLCILPTPYLVNGHYSYFWGLYPKAGLLHPLFLAYFVSVSGLALRQLYLSSEPRGAIVPLKVPRNIFWAFVVGYVASVDFIPSYGLALYPIGYLMVVLWVSIVSYSFVKHQLLDIYIIIKPKVLISAEPVTFITACYITILLLIRLFTGEVQYLLAGILVATFSLFSGRFVYLQMRMEKEIKKTLFRESHDTYETLTAFSKSLVTILDLKSLTGEIVRTLVNVLGATTASLYLRDQEKGAYVLSTSVGQESEGLQGLRFRKEDSLPQHLLHVQSIVVREELEHHGDVAVTDPILCVLKAMEAEACIPLINKGYLIGFCNLGNCIQLKMYSGEDLNMLATLGHNAAIALDNALLYEELKRSQQLMRRTDRLRSLETIAGGFAHEIRNPLTSIKTFVQLAPSRRDDPEFMDEFSLVVQDDVLRIERLIQEILDYARYMEPKLGEEDLKEIITSCLHFVEVQASQKSITIAKDLAENLPRMLLDRQQIKQVLMNLFLNAMDAITNAEGRVTVKAHCLTRPTGDIWVQIEVADTGCGISADNLDHIFDPFFTTKHESLEREGTGLGLVIVHQIIQEHGGNVEVESQVGQGTTFFVNLPVNPTLAGK